LNTRVRVLRRRLVSWLLGHDIFISYARIDAADYTLRLANLLSKRGLLCYVDQLSSPLGRTVPVEVLEAIPRSRVFVVIASKGAVESTAIEEEVNAAVSARLPTIPINVGSNLEECRWASKVAGPRVTVEEERALHAGRPSALVVRRIYDSAKFRRRNLQVQLVAGATTLLVVAVVLAGIYAAREAARFQADAEANAKEAAARAAAAEARQRTVDALSLGQQGSQASELDPGSGMQMLLRAWLQASDSLEARRTLSGLIRRQAARGRLVQLRDIAGVFTLSASPFVIVQPALPENSPSTLHRLRDFSIVGSVPLVWTEPENNQRTIGTLPEAGPYSLLPSDGPTNELLDRRDGARVRLTAGTLQLRAADSPNASHFAIVYPDGRTELRSLANPRVGHETGPWPEHTTQLDFPEGLPFFLAGKSELRDRRSTRLIDRLEPQDGAFERELAVASDRSLVVVRWKAGADARQVELVNRQGRRINPFGRPIRDVVFSPGGRQYVIVYNEGRSEIRRTRSDAAIQLAGRVKQLAFSHDGALVFVSYDDAGAEVRDTTSGAIIYSFGLPLFDISLTSDRSFFVGSLTPTSFARRAVVAWRLSDRTLREFQSTGPPQGVAGKYVILHSDDGTAPLISCCHDELRNFDTGDLIEQAGTIVPVLSINTTPTTFIALRSNDRFDDSGEVVNVVSKRRVRTTGLSPESKERVVFSPDGRHHIILGAKAELRRADDSLVRAFDVMAGTAKFSPDGSRLIVGTNGRTELRDGRTGGLVALLPGTGGRFTEDSRQIVIERDYDDNKAIVDAGTGRLVATSIGEPFHVSGEGRYFVVFTAAGRAELVGGRKARRLAELGADVTEVSIDDRNHRSIVIYRDGRVEILDLLWLETNADTTDASNEASFRLGCFPFVMGSLSDSPTGGESINKLCAAR
jgi:hypothetical protein